jgi:hypothetical protein
MPYLAEQPRPSSNEDLKVHGPDLQAHGGRELVENPALPDSNFMGTMGSGNVE